MSLYLLSAILFTIYTTVHAITECSFHSPPTPLEPFPNTTYLSYNESAKFVLDNYFTGINLTFSYDISDQSASQLIPKVLEYTKGLINDSLPQVNEAQLVDLYWDDSNITSVSQQWTVESLLIFLLYTDSQYTVIAGSFDNIQAANQTDVPQYSSINIQPPPNFSAGSQLQCSSITPVGELVYYIDCMMTDASNGTIYNYFYYLSFPAYPPSNYTVNWALNNMTLSSNPIITPRIIISTTDEYNCTYLVRYYDGLQLLQSFQQNTTQIEVFNVTHAIDPILVVAYNFTTPGFPSLMNISAIKISADYMYVTSAQGSIIIYSDWYTQPQLYQQYSYDQMVFQGASLRVVASQGNLQESFIAVGSLNSVNLTAILLVSQSFQGFFTLPLPPLQQTTLDFDVFSVALGEDFFGVSYSVAETFSNSACYYYAIGDIMMDQSADCHTLWSFEKSNYISYSKMDPANTDILFVLGQDGTYANYSIFRPAFMLLNLLNTTDVTLSITTADENTVLNLTAIVLNPNDQGIYLDFDDYDSDFESDSSDSEISSDSLEKIALQIDSNYIVFLNTSIYGPRLNFTIQSQDVEGYNFYQNQQISGSSNFSVQPGNTFFACRTQHVSGVEPFLLIEKTAAGTASMVAGIITTANIFNITSIDLSVNIIQDIQIFGYSSVNGYDLYLYNQNDEQNIMILDFEQYILFGQPPITASLDMYGGALNEIVITQTQYGAFQVLGINNSSLFLTIMGANGGETEGDGSDTNLLTLGASLSTEGYPFPSDPAFLPAKLQAHWAYPNIAFVTTTAGNYTYVIDFTNMLIGAENQQGGTFSFVVIFSEHPANSDKDVIVQPFENSLFYIYPSLNVIEHWDLSIVRSPFFRRNLDLYSYNLTVHTSSFVAKGTAFSSTTDTLYMIAQDNNSSDSLYVLVLKPNPANAYIVQVVELPFNMNNPQNISIDVTETQNSVYGNLLGDILVAVIGTEYYFWEIYPIPYFTFPVKTSGFSEGKINIQYNATFTVQNEWDAAQTELLIDVYQNEKQISTSIPQINITNNISSITLGVADICTGTTYGFKVDSDSDSDDLNAAVNITSFKNFTGVQTFATGHVLAVLQLCQYTYYLTSDEILLVNNTDSTDHRLIEIISPQGCSMYIDDTETYGVAICGQRGNGVGLFPFSVTDMFAESCSFIALNSFQDIFIDANSSLLFLLMQTEGGNSNITVYNIGDSICDIANPLFVMQGWSFSPATPNFDAFDVLILYSTQTIHMIFVLDLNFGLRVINYASVYNLVAKVESYSFSQLYQYLGFVPPSLQFSDVNLLQNECTLDLQSGCTANLLIVTNNFHTLLLQFQLENSGLDMSSPAYTMFLVPSDYLIDDYEVSGDLLILLGRNMSLAVPSLDMIAYNMSGSGSMSNGLNTEDPTIYQVPMWVTPLVQDSGTIPQFPLVHPTISLSNDDDVYMLSFPSIYNQSTVSYNITRNITVSWDNTQVNQNQINLTVYNNFQEITLPIVFVQEEANGIPIVEPREWFYYVYIGVVLGILLLIIFAIFWYWRKFHKNKIQYSRKLQKDPLKELMLT